MRQVSPAALQAMFAQQTAEVFIPCLVIDHPSFAAPIRLAYDTAALVRAAGTYLPFAFEVTLPDQRDDQLPQVKITIDNTDLSVAQAIRSISGQPTVTLDVVLASQPDTIEAGPFYFVLSDAQADANTITGTLAYEEDIFSQQVPGQTYLPTNSPGMYQ